MLHIQQKKINLVLYENVCLLMYQWLYVQADK